MLSIRTWHTYIGMFIAPSVLFFALTGTLQIFGLHESHDDYKAPMLLEKLASVHKDQVLAKKAHEEPPPGAEAEIRSAEAAEPEPPVPVKTQMLKWLFAVVAVGLCVSTLLGVWMGLKQTRRQRPCWWLLIAGIFLPLGLVVF